jgi:hypothetical protein
MELAAKKRKENILTSSAKEGLLSKAKKKDAKEKSFFFRGALFLLLCFLRLVFVFITGR